MTIATLAGGRFTLLRLLGEGGSKRVYLARDERLDREVALARIDTAGLDDARRLRIEREAQAMARLGDHPNIVTVFDVLEEQGAIWIVTQYMPGGDLARRIDSAPTGRLDIAEATAIAIQICRALEHAHARGVLHRDLKPANVWLAEDGAAKLGDFGLALAVDRSRLTEEGTIVGTVAYMPPEQALGRTRDARSDLYALGTTLYEMLTGKPPFRGEDAVAVLSQHLHTPPVAPRWHNPSIPPQLERLVLELLAKDPEARPASAAAVRGRLQALESGPQPGVQTPTSPPANPLDRLAGGVFVGRSAETQLVRAAFEDTLAGRLRIVLVAGEPGIGKTRLAEELTTYARMRSASVLWGRSHDAEGAPPFWPWMQIVRAWVRDREPRELLADLGPGATDVATLVSDLHTILPGLAAPVVVEPEQARFRMFDAFATMLRNAAARRPLVVVLDDLHWADEASLRLLQFLARELGPARLLLVGTYRDVELRRGHPLTDTLAELSRHRATERILLHGLGAADVELFIAESSGEPSPRGLAEVVHRETEGNPFFVHEVVRLLAAQGKLARAGAPRSWSLEIPQGVREVIGRRLDRLSPSCNEALGVASVLGREFDLPLVARVAAKSEIALLGALDEALSARLVVEVKDAMGRYRFSHALVRDTLYDELSGPRRVSLHRAAGLALDRTSTETLGPRLAEIAHHFFQSVQAGDPERAIAACERAAEWARARNAWEDAGLHLERAVQVLERTGQQDVERHYELLVDLAELQAFGSDPEKTRATALRAASLARRLASPRLLARAALAYGAHLPVIEMGRADEEMVSLLEESLEGLDEEDAALRARVLQRLAHELYFSLDWRSRTSERGHQVLEEALRLAESIGDPALQANIGLSTTLGIRNDLHDGVAADAERLIALAREGQDRTAEQNAWNAFAAGTMWLGDMVGVRRALAEMERLAAELRTPLARYQALRLAGAIAVLEGRFDEASTILRDAIRIAGTAAGGTNVKQWAGLTMWFAARHRGTPMNVEPSYELVERFLGYNIYRVILCGVYLSAGARNDALRELGILATDDFGRIEANASWVPVHALAADLSWDLAQSRYATTLYDRLLSSAGRCPSVWPMAVSLGPVDLRLGRLALMRGRYADAERHLQDAIEIGARMGARPYLAEAHYALALAIARRGGDDDRMGALASLDAALSITRARASLDEALAIARELVMAPLIEAALALMVELDSGLSTDSGVPIPPAD